MKIKDQSVCSHTFTPTRIQEILLEEYTWILLQRYIDLLCLFYLPGVLLTGWLAGGFVSKRVWFRTRFWVHCSTFQWTLLILAICRNKAPEFYDESVCSEELFWLQNVEGSRTSEKKSGTEVEDRGFALCFSPSGFYGSRRFALVMSARETATLASPRRQRR